MPEEVAICLQQSCPRAARMRGLCTAHYNRLQKRVQGGELTWEQAMAQGLCKDRAPKGKPWMDSFYLTKKLRGGL